MERSNTEDGWQGGGGQKEEGLVVAFGFSSGYSIWTLTFSSKCDPFIGAFSFSIERLKLTTRLIPARRNGMGRVCPTDDPIFQLCRRCDILASGVYARANVVVVSD